MSDQIQGRRSEMEPGLSSLHARLRAQQGTSGLEPMMGGARALPSLYQGVYREYAQDHNLDGVYLEEVVGPLLNGADPDEILRQMGAGGLGLPDAVREFTIRTYLNYQLNRLRYISANNPTLLTQERVLPEAFYRLPRANFEGDIPDPFFVASAMIAAYTSGNRSEGRYGPALLSQADRERLLRGLEYIQRQYGQR